MVQMRRRAGQVRAWGESGKRLKIVDEMGLIVVAAIDGDVGPVDVTRF